MLKLISAVLPSVLAASGGDVHYGMWTRVDATVVCKQDWAAIGVAKAFAEHGVPGARSALDESADCRIASNLLVGIGHLVWSDKGVTVVRNLDPKLPYVIVQANYDEGSGGSY